MPKRTKAEKELPNRIYEAVQARVSHENGQKIRQLIINVPLRTPFLGESYRILLYQDDKLFGIATKRPYSNIQDTTFAFIPREHFYELLGKSPKLEAKYLDPEEYEYENKKGLNSRPYWGKGKREKPKEEELKLDFEVELED